MLFVLESDFPSLLLRVKKTINGDENGDGEINLA